MAGDGKLDAARADAPLVRVARGATISGLRRQDAIAGVLFVLPLAIGLLVFELGPFLATVGLSFFVWDIVRPPQWIGVENFVQLCTTDPVYWIAVRNTLAYTVGTVVPGFFVSLLLAVALNQKLKGTSVYRMLFYMPSITSVVAVSAVWALVYNSNFGLINLVLGQLGVPPIAFLGSPDLALPSIIVMSIWRQAGYFMVLFLAGLQGIHEEYYEARKIDGASAWQRFWRVTFPLISPTSFFVIVLKIIWAVQVFDAMFVMTAGGPAYATYPLLMLLYESAFLRLQMGYASAAGTTLFLALFAVTLLQLRLQRRWVHYQ